MEAYCFRTCTIIIRLVSGSVTNYKCEIISIDMSDSGAIEKYSRNTIIRNSRDVAIDLTARRANGCYVSRDVTSRNHKLLLYSDITIASCCRRAQLLRYLLSLGYTGLRVAKQGYVMFAILVHRLCARLYKAFRNRMSITRPFLHFPLYILLCRVTEDRNKINVG